MKFLISASLAHSFKQAANTMSDVELRERIKRQIGELPWQEEDVDIAPDKTIQMPIDGSIILTIDTAEKLSKILDNKLRKKRSSI